MPKSASRYGLISIIVGAAIMALKFLAYHQTGSQAILSDALEGIINVVAAGAAYGVLRLSSRPADKNHPYGHGKAEYFSASFEGGLITFAGLLIVIAAGHALVGGNALTEIGFGVAVAGGAGFLNLLLGIYLLRAGRKTQSSALVASGHHVLSDFWTTAGTVVGLLIVRLTGWAALDSIMAIGIGALLLFTGVKIARQAMGGLLDEEDEEALEGLVTACNAVQFPGVIKVHYVRAIRSGAYHIVDAHVVVPEFWKVLQAHDEINLYERKLIEAYSHKGEIHFHMDPCRRAFCAECDLAECPIRAAAFVARTPYTIERLRAKKVKVIEA